MADNPLEGTGELSVDELRDAYSQTEPTVDELLAGLETEDYSADQLYALQSAEREDRDRKTAHEALNSAIEDASGVGDDDYEVDAESEDGLVAESEDSEDDDVVGEDVGSFDTEPEEADQEDNQDMDLLNAEANSSNEGPTLQQAVKGGGATNAGDQPLNLPDPRGDDAPDTVRIVVEPMVLGFGGNVYESGEHDVSYSKRVKQSLEADTNDVHLSDSDPLYPEKDDEE